MLSSPLQLLISLHNLSSLALHSFTAHNLLALDKLATNIMSNVCAEQLQHKFHLSHQFLSSKKTIQIPPRNLLSRNRSDEMFNYDSPRFSSADEKLFRKFLPYNGGDEDESDLFASDHFRMYEFKVRRCTRSRSHDWTDCPFAHPGEKAQRRDPRRYHYSGTVCADYRRGECSRGDNCEFAHGVFECWLHPSRYRTEACKDGKNCTRKVCFFAHSPRELRVLPSNHCQSSEVSPGSAGIRKYRNSAGGSHCCMFCQSVTNSPTSTLLGGFSHLSSPPLSPNQSSSPPLSPFKPRFLSGLSSTSRYNDRVGSRDSSQVCTYKDMLKEIMSSLEEMNFNEMNSPMSSNSNRNVPWIDLPLVAAEDDQQQFILSSTTPNPIGSRNCFNADSPAAPSPSGSRSFFHGDSSRNGFTGGDNKDASDNGSYSVDPDLGWVNDLLM